MVGESEGSEQRHHQQGGGDRVVRPGPPAQIGPYAPCEKERHKERRVEGDEVADEMKGLVDEQPIADNGGSRQELEQRYETRGTTGMQFQPQGKGKGDEQETEEGEGDSLRDAERGELQCADSLAYRIVRSGAEPEHQKGGDKEKAGKAGAKK